MNVEEETDIAQYTSWVILHPNILLQIKCP